MPIKPPPPRYARHPFEVCIMVSFMFSCLSLSLFGPSASQNNAFDVQVQIALAGSVVFGSVLVLLGAFWREILLAAFFELAGVFCTSGAISVWVIGVVLQVHNWSSGLGAASLCAILGACVWRGFQIIRWFLWIYQDHPPEFWEQRKERDELRRYERLLPGETVLDIPTLADADYIDEDIYPLPPPPGTTWREPEQ